MEAGHHKPLTEAAIQRTIRRRLFWTLGLNGLFFVWLFCCRANRDLVGIGTNLAYIASMLVGFVWSLQGRRSGGSDAPRRRWRPTAPDLFSVFLLNSALGQIIYAYNESVLHKEVLTPSAADGFWLTGAAVAMLGALLLPSRPLPAALRGRVFLDALMTLCALVTFSWRFLIGPILLTAEGGLLTRFIALAYPVSDLGLLMGVLLVSAVPQESLMQRGRACLGGGILLFALSDSVYGYLGLQGTYYTGMLTDIGWLLAGMLIGLGACILRTYAALETPRRAAETTAQRAPVLWRSLLPYAFVPAVSALLLYTLARPAEPLLNVGVYIGAALLIGLILCRQVFALLENQDLFRRLQTAYAELEAKNRETAAYAEQQEQLNEELCAMQAELVSNNLALEQANGELAAANARLESLATTDSMTGLPNHRHFQERLRAELARAERTGQPLSLLLLDVDHFKQYNDAFGHPAGDEVLRGVGKLLREIVRQCDLPARYGGEEFAVVLPDTDAAGAVGLAERLRAAVEAHAFPNRQITLSSGVADIRIAGRTAEDLISCADRALYAAKRSGRNRVVCAAPEQAMAA